MPLSDGPPDELRRLEDAWYRGTAWVHWTMAVEDRRKGWLNDFHHSRVREILIHLCARYSILCPAYCLMPDHGHFLFMGLSDASDQRNAVKFFRKAWNRLLADAGCLLQKQSYDHVLQETERNPEAFEDTMIYILKNPQRAGLVEDWRDWPSLGAIAAGYPDFEPKEGFQPFSGKLWKIHHHERAKLT